MSKISKYIIMAAIIGNASAAMAADPSLKVYDVDVNINEPAHLLNMVIDLNMKDFKLSRDSETIFTPVIIASNRADSLELAPITVCGRNRYYYYVRQGLLDTGNARIFRSGSKEMVKISETVDLEPWMSSSSIEMRQESASCCGSPKIIPGDSESGNVTIARISTGGPQLLDDYVFSPPRSNEAVKKSVEGKAFVTFVVNRTELDPTYMDNPVEIKKILNSIDIVKADPDAQITEVHIRGYASPDGPYENNVMLAKGRTQTLANYVNQLYKFEPGIMTTSYDPEDWKGLESYVTDSMNYNLNNRQALLSIINGPLGFDEKDLAMKTRFPADYEVIRQQIYPWLRHSDYTVNYTIKVYTELSDLLRLYNSDPSKLRPVDFYTIAQQYPTGSKQYLDVMKKALEVYPDEPMINLNIANLYLMEGDFDAAQSCLLKAGQNPEANFARGVMAAKRGDVREAEKYFTMAKEAGIPQAEGYLKQLNSFKTYNPVDIVVKTTK